MLLALEAAADWGLLFVAIACAVGIGYLWRGVIEDRRVHKK
jgi:hypothetical protein